MKFTLSSPQAEKLPPAKHSARAEAIAREIVLVSGIAAIVCTIIVLVV